MVGCTYWQNNQTTAAAQRPAVPAISATDLSLTLQRNLGKSKTVLFPTHSTHSRAHEPSFHGGDHASASRHAEELFRNELHAGTEEGRKEGKEVVYI